MHQAFSPSAAQRVPPQNVGVRSFLKASTSSPWRVGLVAVGAVCVGAPLTSVAQPQSALITRNLPYPDYRKMGEDHYGLRLGSVFLRYDVSFAAIYTDNRNYSDSNPKEDFGLRPVFNAGLFYPINDRQKVQVDVGIGYQWWANSPEADRLYVAPNSHLDYTFGIGDVMMRVSNNTSTSTEASDRPEFSGGDGDTNFSFNRISNSTGLSANWVGSRRLSLNGAYSFLINRTLNDQFQELDRNTHSFSASALVRVTVPISVGLSGRYSMFDYMDNVQNGGQSFSIGPAVTWQPLDSLIVNAYVHYSKSLFDEDGTIGDRSDFSGAVFGVSADHVMNRYITQTASISRGIDPGFGSNYTDEFSVRYGIGATISSRLTGNLSFRYRSAELSGFDGEKADLFTVSLGSGYQILRRANLGLTYSMNTRSSDKPSANYWENRVTLTASYQF